MSILNRLDEADLLWQQGKKEGAWALVLIAAAATARKRYPKPASDRKAFTTFIRDVQETIMYGRSPAKPMPKIIFGTISIEDLLYQEMRCYLVHEAELPSSTTIAPSKLVDGKLQATLKVGDAGNPHEIPDFWVLHLAQAIREAPENK